MRKAWLALVAAVVLTAAPALWAQTATEWTVMVYLNGEGGAGSATTNYEDASIRDFNELEVLGSTQNVNVVCQWDRAIGDDELTTAFPTDVTQNWSGAKRYLLVADPSQQGADPDTLTGAGLRINSPALVDLGEVDMSSPTTLYDFVSWTIARFPARHYALVLNGAGQGWQPRSVKRGMLNDPTGGGANSDGTLSNAELTSVLSQIKVLRSGANLDALILDTGASAILEVANQTVDLVDTYLGCFLDRRANGGLPYNVALQTLNTILPTTSLTTEGWLRQVATNYLASYGANTLKYGGEQSVGVGVYRVAGLPAVVQGADDLAAALSADLRVTAAGMFRVLSKVQRGRPTDYTTNYVDLRHFAALCATEFAALPEVVAAAQALMASIDAMLVVSPAAATAATDWPVNDFKGLGVYFPATLADYDTTYPRGSDFGTTGWPELIQGLYSLYSDRNPPTITVISPANGATILDNPPTIVASIVDPDTVGGVDPDSVTITFDGTLVPASDYTFNADTGLLTYTLPSALGATGHTYTITASDLSGNVATPVTGGFRVTVATMTSGIQTFSLPRVLSAAQNDPALVFGAGNFSLVRWVPGISGSDKYRFYPDALATFLPADCGTSAPLPIVTQPPAGLGYWVRVKESRPLSTLPGVPVTSAEYGIRLATDGSGPTWNMIGSPYDLPSVALSGTQVQLTDGRRISFRQAVDQRLTTGVLFTYVPNAGNANAPGSYSYGEPGTGQLLRMQGHWLKTNTPITLVVNSGVAARGLGQLDPPNRALAGAGWQVVLKAAVACQPNDYADGRAYDVEDRLTIGSSSQASDGFDPLLDVASPPAIAGGAQLRVVNGGWGADSGRYVRDLRGGAADLQWDLELAAPAGEVTLNWPDLRAVPGDVQLVLTDLTNGQARSLRTSAGYSFGHSGGTRAFRLTAERSAGRALLITELSAQPTRGGRGLEIGYTLSRAAQVRVQVTSLAGRTIKALGPVAATVGRGRVAWDGDDDEGRPAPNGLYQIMVLASTPDGGLARELRMVRVMR